jgi:hypothetical protein
MLVPVAGQPIIQQDSGCARIFALTALTAGGDRRCKSLIEELNWDRWPERRAEFVGEGARLARLFGVATGERKRQADDYAINLTLGDQLA